MASTDVRVAGPPVAVRSEVLERLWATITTIDEARQLLEAASSSSVPLRFRAER